MKALVCLFIGHRESPLFPDGLYRYEHPNGTTKAVLLACARCGQGYMVPREGPRPPEYSSGTELMAASIDDQFHSFAKWLNQRIDKIEKANERPPLNVMALLLKLAPRANIRQLGEALWEQGLEVVELHTAPIASTADTVAEASGENAPGPHEHSLNSVATGHHEETR